MRRDVIKSVGRVVGHMFFFYFVSQAELIASKVILLLCTKLIVRVSHLFAIFSKRTCEANAAGENSSFIFTVFVISVPL